MTHSTDTIDNPASYTCLELRREKLADPKRLSAAAHEHLKECALCQAFARRIDAQESRYAEALAVPIPDALAERVILRARHGRRNNAWRFAALAATVILSVGVVLQWTPDLPGQGAISPARIAITHVLHEPQAFESHVDIDPARLQAVMASFGGEMEQAALGKVRYIKLCPLEHGGTGWHIVFETEHGLATLLLVPGGADHMKADSASGEGLQALVRPAGQGYYALVMDSLAGLQAMDSALRSKVRWKT